MKQVGALVRTACVAIGLPGRVALGALLAILLGVLFRETGAMDDTFIRALRLPGLLWLRMLRLVVVPLVFSIVVTAITSLRKMTAGSKLGVAVVVYYLTTTALATTEGLLFSAAIIVPNVEPIDVSGLPASVAEDFEDRMESVANERDAWDQFQGILEGFTPTNVVGSAANGDLLGVISFAIMFAIALPLPAAGEKSATVDLMDEVGRAMFRMIEALIFLTPLGVFSLLVERVILLDIAEIIDNVGIFLGTVFAGLAFHNFVTYPVIFFALTRRNPFSYMRGIVPAMMTALATSSSASTLPVTIRCAIENNRVPPELAKFVLSLGATVNMDGTAIGFPIAVIFLAYAQGLSLTAGQAISAAVVSVMSSVGAAPVPSAGLVFLFTILESADVPVNALFGLIIAVDWIYDRPETMTNIVGDSFAAGIMTHWFGKGVMDLDVEQGDLPVESRSLAAATGAPCEGVAPAGAPVVPAPVSHSTA